MKIEFRKILSQKKPFSLEKDGILFFGNFKKLPDSMIEIELNIKGSFVHQCDGCANDFDLDIDQNSTLLVSDGVYKGDEINVYESFNHFVDFDDICKSELESFKSDYHYCKDCIENFKE